MKYEILNTLREYLNATYSKNTAERYYYAVDKLLRHKHFNSVKDIDPKFLEEGLLKIRNQSDFSATKNGLLQLKRLYPALMLPGSDFFEKIKKRNWSVKPKKTIYYNEVLRKVSALPNEKFRMAYRLMMASGLRVAETAQLTSKDIAFREDGGIQVHVRHGKGGSNGVVECIPDKYLMERLPAYIAKKEDDEKLFYAASTMKNKAAELGIECHDLRRVAAIRYRKQYIKENGTENADDAVQSMLRHERFSTTKRYLYNRKLKIRRERS